MTAFLDVERSLGGKRWEAGVFDERAAGALETQLGAPPVIAQLLAGRGLTVETAPAFLSPRLKEAMPDPSALKDMDAAVARFIKAVESGEKITVFGDYDVDGATSSALLVRFGRALGIKINVYVPDRIKEGYGPNSAALEKIKNDGTSLVITVDCGITAHEPLATAKQLGLDVVVLDHHAAEPALPPGSAIVNPNRLDENNSIGNCAAVGVVFLFIAAANRALRAKGFYASRPEPDLMQWLDIVALGTVADVVPLTGLNRAYVSQGLKVMGQRQNAGIAALGDVGRMTNAPDAFACGFILGPRVNAGGRVGQSDLGARILSTDDATEARELAALLDSHNTARKEIEAQVLEEAIRQTEGHSGNIVIAVGQGWHPGVIGVVASRLKERFYRPTFVIAVDEKGIGKGSGRSIRGVDLGALTIAARQSGLLINGGGHAMAAGLTVANDNVTALREFFETRLQDVLTAEVIQPRLVIDGLLGLGALTPAFFANLQQLSPFGSGNPEPRFALANCKVVFADIVGTDHVRAMLTDNSGQRVKGIAFRSADTPLGQALLAKKTLHIAGRLTLNTWNGKSDVEIQIEDGAVA
ncbi:MAG: single-stranded-DNA-specific exonuclease RecJ [Bdellovibrionales bacterium]